MRTSILATTAAIGMAIAAPAQAQQSTAPGQQQIQSDKQMQEEADKGIKTRELRSIRICRTTANASCFRASARTSRSERQPDHGFERCEWRPGLRD